MKTFLNQLSENQNIYFLLYSFLLLIYFFPFLYYGENSGITIHDNMDSNIVWIKLLIDNQMLISSPNKVTLQVLNGLNRAFLYPSIDFCMILFKLFGIYWGYIFNKMFMSALGFFGMFFLLKNHFVEKKDSLFPTFITSLFFSFLPFWSFSGSIAGLPLFLFAILNIRNNCNANYNWVIVALYPFFSSLILVGIFILFVVIIIITYDYLITKKLPTNLIMAVLVCCTGYISSHIYMFYSFFFSEELTSRIEYKFEGKNNFPFKNIKDIFINGQYHAHSLHKLFIIPIMAYLVILMNDFNKNKRLFFIFFFIAFTAFFYGLYFYEPFIKLNNSITKIVPITFRRFHFLHPLFWYILIGVTLNFFWRKKLIGKISCLLMIFIQLNFLFKNSEYYVNRWDVKFNDFFAVNQFSRIEKYIAKPKSTYRVISVGMHPSIAQYNGFFTLDGYFINYPLKYKYEFRKVIIEELKKDSLIKKYYDNWGSRIYAFSAEKGIVMESEFTKKYIENLNFNYGQLKKMKCEYIFSRYLIQPKTNREILLLKTFENNKNQKLPVYLYKIL